MSAAAALPPAPDGAAGPGPTPGGAVATMVCDVLGDQLAVDFSQACADLRGARRRQQAEDDRLHRAAVAECRDRVDVVLDMYLEVRGRDG